MFLRSVLAASAVALCYGADNTFMKPIKAGDTEIAVIWIQGAQCPQTGYVPLLQELQKTSEHAMWVGQPSYLLDTPEPVRLQAGIDNTLKLMTDAGMGKDVKVFYAAHSLGTVFLQMFCAKNVDRCAGQILAGGFIARTSYYPSFSYPVPTLTMGGSLDGLARVTRTGAEAYYQQIEKADQGEDFPVVVIEGMNHWQWSSGKPAALVGQRDLMAELTEVEAHTTAATLMSDFIDKQLGVGKGSLVASAVAQTKTFVAPLIKAYELEGSRHYDAPRQIKGPGASECVKGGCPDSSGWTGTAQAIIAGDLQGWKFESKDEFVDCSSTPITGGEFHLPNITNDTTTKTVFGTTYSQCNWDLGDAEDTGFVYTSASEIGAKLSSRQCLLIKGVGLVDTPFSVDDPDFCKMANQQAYDWALANAGQKTAARYNTFGQIYTFGADIQKAGGPLFLDAGITYKDNGDDGVEISSPAQKTEQNYWPDHFGPIPRPSGIPDPGCFHYCKLLSPARAMEWIYVDGLRRNLPINKTEEKAYF